MSPSLRIRLVVAVLALVASVAAGRADDHPLRGVALVIGQSAYSGMLAPLANPKNDARAIDNLLEDLGFDVTRVLDGDDRKLSGEIADFEDEAKHADVALIYYSGHGIEAGGENYLVPVDADLSTPARAGETLIPVSGVLDQLARDVPVTILLLDACRTGAFPAGTMIQPPGAAAPVPAVEAGLAAVRGPSAIGSTLVSGSPDSLGMVIGFAASPGQPALDAAPGESNSPYAAALLKHLGAAGYSFGDVMTMVSEEVYLKTRAQQLPWTNSSLRRVLSFGAPIEDADPDETALRQGRRQLLLSIASATPATRSYVEGVATTEGVPLDALYGMLKVLGVDTSGGAANLEQQLEQGARQLKQFKEQELGTAGADPELVRLAGLAQRAQDEGAMDLSLKYREQATARARTLSSERDTLEAGLKADRLEIAKTFADHGQTAALNFDYDTAAQMFGEAYDQIAKWDDELALAYKQDEAEALRNFGDYKADNTALQRSIDAYKEALLLAPKDKRLSDWVSINTNLGWALETLGERVSDEAALNEAVTVLQAAIDTDVPGRSPSDRAVSRLNLGNAVSLLGQRDSDFARMQQAVDIYKNALADLTRDADPYNWGKLSYNLAMTLRVMGDRNGDPATLERAIAAFEGALATVTRDLSPLEWAQSENGYGTALFGLAELRHDVSLYNRAAEALNLSLEENTEERVPLDWAMAEANLGNVYVQLSQEQNDLDSLRQGIDAYKASLRQLPADKLPFYFATAQTNLGTALTALFEKTNDRSLLGEAVTAFNAALEVRTRQNDPPDWAMTEYNLSTALTELGSDEVSPDHLHQAVDAANAALTQWTKAQQPILWAKGHYALGMAYAALGDRETTSESYKAAADEFGLTVGGLSKTDNASEWLTAAKKYAFALETVGERDESPDFLNRALAAYRDALTLVTLDGNRAEFARLNFNMGLCLLNLDAYGALADGFVQAADAFRTALTGYTRADDPEDWADTQYRLGYALHSAAAKLPSGGEDQVRAAIAAYGAAQEVHGKDADPAKWAEIETYLATAHGLLGVRINDKAEVQAGRDAMAAAWDVYKSRDHSYDADFEARLKTFDDALAAMD